jgi:hypothetical protein
VRARARRCVLVFADQVKKISGHRGARARRQAGNRRMMASKQAPEVR